jgi:hypothetical protein
MGHTRGGDRQIVKDVFERTLLPAELLRLYYGHGLERHKHGVVLVHRQIFLEPTLGYTDGSLLRWSTTAGTL